MSGYHYWLVPGMPAQPDAPNSYTHAAMHPSALALCCVPCRTQRNQECMEGHLTLPNLPRPCHRCGAHGAPCKRAAPPPLSRSFQRTGTAQRVGSKQPLYRASLRCSRLLLETRSLSWRALHAPTPPLEPDLPHPAPWGLARRPAFPASPPGGLHGGGRQHPALARLHHHA